MSNQPPPVPGELGSQGFDKAPFNKGPWIGCLVAVLVVIIGIVATVTWVWNKAKGAMASAGVSLEELQTKPERVAAKLALAVNPDIELVSEDEASGSMTIKLKSSGETMTISYKDIAEGRIVFRNGKGEEVVIDGKRKDGTVVMRGEEGTTVIGGEGEAVQPPSWVPLHTSMTLMKGGMKTETADAAKGTCLAESAETVDSLRAFYEQKFKDGGFSAKSTLSGTDSAMISASSADSKTSLTVMISKSENDGKSTVMLHYNGPR